MMADVACSICQKTHSNKGRPFTMLTVMHHERDAHGIKVSENPRNKTDADHIADEALYALASEHGDIF